MTARRTTGKESLWFKDAIFYQLRVRSFYDSDGDGIGDFRGLSEKLDYLQDLGITTLWLLPFYPSPLRDDGYDISDYTDIHPDCGTLSDFKHFLREAHRRDLRVVTELVINHTSDQHPWFQRSRRAKPGEKWRDFYVWSDTAEEYKEARIIFQDFESSNWSWDPVAKAYFWHRFYSNQPDLNFDSPQVRRAIFQAMDFWLGLGVDGLRLDAVPYLFEREGTNCENLPETHAFLRDLRRHVDRKFPNRMLLAEANQWPEDAVKYFGDNDECHMAFNFPIMPRLFLSAHMESRSPVIDILEQTPEIPKSAQWALFLRNHDELTLEMVTEEERDYMYRAYAVDPHARINLGIRRRLAPLLGNDRNKIELMNGLLFSLPGTPILYYGDEIGMGDNYFLGDRNGVRTPMQWSPDRNAGFSQANPQRLFLPVIVDPEYNYEAINLETQQNNPHSLLWWMKRLITLRKRYKAFGRGSVEFLHPRNHKVLTFIRKFENERILVVANLSRFVQYVELDLSDYQGMTAVEMFGGTEFPPIGDLPYLLTLGPHAFYWFSIERQGDTSALQPIPRRSRLPELAVKGSTASLFRNETKDELGQMLATFLPTQRWFGGKAKKIRTTKITDVVSLPQPSDSGYITFTQVDYEDGRSESYLLPLAVAWQEKARQVLENSPHSAIAKLRGRNEEQREGVLYDALEETGFCQTLLEMIARRRRLKGSQGDLVALSTRIFRDLRGEPDILLTPVPLRSEQSNSSVDYGNRLILKLYRRLGGGVNPDLEIGKFLTEKTGFKHIPPVAGSIEYRVGRHESVTLATLQGFVPNQGDAWKYTLDELQRFYERALTKHHQGITVSAPSGSPLDFIESDPPPLSQELVGGYLEAVRLLGRRTAELHLALSSDPDEPQFAPEPFTALYRRSLYQSMRNLTRQTFQLLRERPRDVPKGFRKKAQQVFGLEKKIFKFFQQLLDRRLKTMRIRTHGDYHLGQVLYTGNDFVIMDFEGEPARSLSERRLKRSPLGDVAGMLRSFHYAAYTYMLNGGSTGVVRPEDIPILEPWARIWYLWVSAAFLDSYLEQMTPSTVLPPAHEDLELMLNVFLMEKAIYELNYELNNRPDWVRIPLLGILDLSEIMK